MRKRRANRTAPPSPAPDPDEFRLSFAGECVGIGEKEGAVGPTLVLVLEDGRTLTLPMTRETLTPLARAGVFMGRVELGVVVRIRR